jgi:hypothetical protein
MKALRRPIESTLAALVGVEDDTAPPRAATAIASAP